MRIETIVIAFILLQTNIRTNIINMIPRVDLQNFEYFPNTPKSPNPNRKLSYRVGINLAPEHRTWSPTNFRNEVSCNVPHLYRSSPFFFYLLPTQIPPSNCRRVRIPFGFWEGPFRGRRSRISIHAPQTAAEYTHFRQ